MDVTTVVGIIIGFVLLFTAIFRGGGIGIFINIPSMMITGGGTIAAVLINYPLSDIVRIVKVVGKAFIHKPITPVNTINFLVEMAGKARKEGFVALESDVNKVEDRFLKMSLQFVVDGAPPDRTRKILESEIESLQERHSKGEGIFLAAGKFAPAFGMLGTLIGLIQMLRVLDDPSKIGPGMATALVTTFYGVILANLIFLPIAGKLGELTNEEVLEKRLIIEGIVSIQSGDIPMVVEEKLRSYLPPDVRAKIVRKKVTSAGVSAEGGKV